MYALLNVRIFYDIKLPSNKYFNIRYFHIDNKFPIFNKNDKQIIIIEDRKTE